MTEDSVQVRPMRERLISAALLVPALVALGIARWLEPAVQGHGTHTQLGLNSCSILSWTGYPCPMCGMTTAFSLLAHFRPIQALLVQPFGAVLFLLTVAVAAIALVELVWPTGRWQRLWSLVRPYEGWLTLAFLLGLALGWIYKIWQML